MKNYWVNIRICMFGYTVHTHTKQDLNIKSWEDFFSKGFTNGSILDHAINKMNSLTFM